MNKPRPTTRCMRGVGSKRLCGRPFSDHDQTTRACPDDSGRVFKIYRLQSTRASGSFSKEEIDALDFMLTGVRSGKDLRIFARTAQRPLTSVARKLAVMKRSMELRAQEERAPDQQQESQEDPDARRTQTRTA